MKQNAKTCKRGQFVSTMMMMMRLLVLSISLTVLFKSFGCSSGFVVGPSPLHYAPRHPMSFLGSPSDDNEPKKQGGIFQAIGGFFEELDAFMDDAS